jgi:DNA (cytosine-5)-methyltransferase 1
VEHSAGEQVGLSGRARQPRETDSGELADSNRAIASEERPERSGQFLQSREDEGVGVGLANNNNTGPEGRECLSERPFEFPAGSRGLVNGYWSGADWVFCQDQKYRPIEPGSAPLATGVTNRVGKLRGYGNALTAPVAQGFIEAYLEVTQHA